MSLNEKIIDYNENEKDIKEKLLLKGEYRYETIISFLEKNGIKCSWKNVTDAMRYDRRIQHNMFKYFILLEDVFRAELYRQGKFNPSKEEPYDGFTSIIKKYKELDDSCFLDGINSAVLKADYMTIKELRNGIMHNDILLGNVFDKKRLDEAIKYVYEILPISYKKGMADDINGCTNKLSNELNSIYVVL